MGNNSAGVFIKCSPDNYPLDELAIHFFGKNLVPVTPNLNSYSVYNYDLVQVFKLSTGIIIFNYPFSNLFFQGNRAAIKRTFQYFNNQASVFTYQRFDSTSSYGYTVWENRQCIRTFGFWDTNSVLTSVGDLLPPEQLWLGGKSRLMTPDSDPDWFTADRPITVYQHQQTLEEDWEDSLASQMVELVMKEYVGCMSWELSDISLEGKNYQAEGWTNLYNEMSVT